MLSDVDDDMCDCMLLVAVVWCWLQLFVDGRSCSLLLGDANGCSWLCAVC